VDELSWHADGGVINGLPLPRELLRAIEDGRWPGQPDPAVLREVFGDQPEAPRFYTLDVMASVNRVWRERTDEVFIGLPSDETPPGDIDPRRSPLIAELGTEQLVALDYRSSEDSPRVLYLTEATPSPW
jgi:hypothetical protein